MSDHYLCCPQVADVICNRQAIFIETLREARPKVEQCHATMLCFKSDLERRKATQKDRDDAVKHIADAMSEIVKILANSNLNISSSERMVMRQINEELDVLRNHLEDLDIEELEQITSQSDRELIAKVSTMCENLREYMRWVDEKTERRWWLVDFIQFLQIFIKLALFVSAAVAVEFYQEQTASIVTLAITLLQGVVEVLDQFFVRKLKPKQIQLSLISIDRPGRAV